MSKPDPQTTNVIEFPLDIAQVERLESVPPTKHCRTCEWFDGGGEAAKRTALDGDCLNCASDRFTPEWDHVCSQWMEESEDSDD